MNSNFNFKKFDFIWYALFLICLVFSISTVSANAATTITAVRNLPDYTPTPGTVTISLAIHIDGDLPNGLIVKEYIPTGWQINSSSPTHSSFDADTGFIEWVLFGSAISQDTALTYELQVPSTETAFRSFQGYVLYNDGDGNSQTVNTGGDQNLSTYYQNLSLTRNLPQTYDSPSWMDISLVLTVDGQKPNGVIIDESIPEGTQIVSSNPVHSSFNADTGEIKWVFVDQEIYPRTITYRLLVPDGANTTLNFSGTLKYNDPQSQAVSVAINGDNAVSFAGTTQQVTATRYLPDTCMAGKPVDITISLYVAGTAPNGLIIKENIPAGWMVTASQPFYDTFDSTTGEIKWLFSGTDVVSQTILYTLSVPADDTGSKTFSGHLLYNDVTQTAQTVTVVGDKTTLTNQTPVANAGNDQSVNEGDTVNLNAAASNDPDGFISAFQWIQNNGSAVALSDETAASTVFTAPQVGIQGDTLNFELTVTDDNGSTDTDSVTVYVSNIVTAGDINDNGTVDLADAVLAFKVMCHMDIGQNVVTYDADVNGDGNIGLQELIYILQKVATLRD